MTQSTEPRDGETPRRLLREWLSRPLPFYRRNWRGTPGEVPAGWIEALLLFVAYFLAGKLGLKFATINPSATALWPPTGIALAGFLFFGYAVWPAVLIGAFLVNVTTAGGVFVSMGIAAGNTLEGLAGAYLVNRFARGLRVFEKAEGVLQFALLAGVVATMVSASIGVATLCLGGMAKWANFRTVWTTWWLGDMGGALVVAPPIILWMVNRRLRWKERDVVELVFVAAALLFASDILFGPASALGERHYPLDFIAVPILFWVAYRYSQRETATVVLLLSVIASWGTIRGRGPFARGHLNDNLLLLQVFMDVNSVLALAFAAVVSEYRSMAGVLSGAHNLGYQLQRRIRDVGAANETLLDEVAERRRVEDAIRMYFDLVQNTPVGLMVLEWDDPADPASLNLVATNPAAERIIGVSALMLYGKLPESVLRRIGAMVSPDVLRDVIDSGVARNLDEVAYSDGRAERSILAVQAFPLAERRVGLAFRDITQRKKAEEAAHRLAAIAESSSHAIVGTELDGTVTSWNAGAVALFGYSADEIMGKPVHVLAPRRLRGEVDDSLRQVRAGRTIHSETRRVRKNGTSVDIALTISPVRNESGEIVGCSRVEEDITERKSAEEALSLMTEELKRSNAELSLFASIVSHELQEPLRKIIAFGDLLKGPEVTKEKDREEYIQKMQNAAARMRRLVDDMLSLTRVTTNAKPLERVDLGELVRDVAADFKARAEQAGGRIRVGPLPAVLADEQQMRQLFENLLSNALKFRDKKKPLRINVSSRKPREGFVEMRVWDNGVGFDEQYRDRLFKPFQRLHSRGEYEGSGMGLAICERILARHGGEISVRSRAGKGTLFSVILPEMRAAPVPVAA